MARARDKLRWMLVPPDDLGEPETALAGLRERIEEEAEAEGLAPLSKRQWSVIRYVLDYYWRVHEVPVAVRIGRALGLGVRQLHELFPAGAVKTTFRLAGLELPPETPHRKSLTWWN